MKCFWLTLNLVLFTYLAVYAQDTLQTKPKVKISWGFKGQIGITSDFENGVFVHFGGPGITLSVNKVGLLIGMFPSARFYQVGNLKASILKTRANGSI
jgi:hypothetical protein